MNPIIPMEPKKSSIIPAGGEWIHQIKWDGVRILAYFDGKTIRLYNRKKRERTFHYPELTARSSFNVARSFILDGEVIALGQEGRPSFNEVMRRDGLRRIDKVEQVRRVVPITYMVFDIIYWDGKWMNKRPLSERIQLLQRSFQPSEHIRIVDSIVDGSSLFEVMKEHGMEGIVSKRIDSPYIIGGKTDGWLKTKNHQDLVAVIGGFTLNNGVVNAILLGLYDDDGLLTYIGHAGTGKLTRQAWKGLTDLLQPLVIIEHPFRNIPERNRDAYWVQPAITVKIQYIEWTKGRSLRQPSIQGIVDENPALCLLRQEMLS